MKWGRVSRGAACVWAVCMVHMAGSSSLPGRPKSARKFLGIAMRWECGDCSVSVDLEPAGRHTHAAQAWCVYSCSLDSMFPRRLHTGIMQREGFLVVVNRWIQEQLVSAQVPHSQVCAAWHSAANANTARGGSVVLPACPANCGGPTPRQEPVNMANTIACVLRAGHISITPVQIVLMPVLVEMAQSFAGDVGMRRLLAFWLPLILIGVVVGTAILAGSPKSNNNDNSFSVDAPREQVRVFSYSAWHRPASAGTCRVCSVGEAGCIERGAVMLSPVSGRFVTSDIPSSAQPLVFGTTWHVSDLTEKQLKDTWKAWNSEVVLGARVEAQVSSPASVVPCPLGINSACLENKGAVSARLCLFKNQCWSKGSLFGLGYAGDAGGDAHFMLRGRAAFTLAWYADTQCGFYRDAQVTAGPAHFSPERQSFQIQIAETCDTCGTGAQPGVAAFDSESGVVTCEACAAMDVIVRVRAIYAGCSGELFHMKCVECPVNTEPFQTPLQATRNEFSVPQQCHACRELLDNDRQYPRGSHRPLGLDGCRNCSTSSFFNSVACQPLQSMSALADRTLAGRDAYKASEYAEQAVAADHFRNAAFEQQACACNNRHKYAQFCGGYALRDANAWMRHTSSENLVLLKDFGPQDLVAHYAIHRQGVCQPCDPCTVGSFNGACARGSKGSCASCRALASCPASPPHFLEHEHPQGCEQLQALADYACVRCKAWERVGRDYMLLVGCGDQNLRRWTPLATAVGGVLDVVVCSFGSDASTGALSPQCQHRGAQLQRQRPFGNYSSLLPYCPPGWFFSCSAGSVYDAFSGACCTKCRECPAELKKKTGLWAACTGTTNVDTQSSQCTARCENNMYEQNGTCLYCNTCKEGEL